MRTLSRYFLASFLSLFFSILSAMMVAMAVTEVLVNYDDVFGSEGFDGALHYLALRLPAYYLGDAIPIAAFAATFFCLGLPAYRQEITAVKASGISPQRVVAPLLAAALVLSGLSLVLNETLVLEAYRQWARISQREAVVTFQRGSFWYQRDDKIFNVADADRESRTLLGVRVFALGPRGRLVSSIHAPRATISESGEWSFENAVVRRYDPSRADQPPVLEHSARSVLPVATRRDIGLLGASATNLDLPELLEFIAARAREGRNTTHAWSLFHGRLVQPLCLLLFTVLAVPWALSVERTRSFAASAVGGVVVISLFFAVRGTAAVFAARGVAGASSVPWLLLAAFGALGTWQLVRISR